MRAVLLLGLTTIASLICHAAGEKVTATGRVTDAEGNPVQHATVLVYSAGVKKGYNIYCPTCYVDCGKRAFTGPDGEYKIPNLSGNLRFNLLVVREGYGSKFVEKVDPATGPAATASLQKRTPIENPAQSAKGIIVDLEGKPIKDVLVEQHGAIFANGGQSYGSRGWIDLIAVSNDRGEFEIAYEKPLQAAILSVSPRGMASKLETIPTGPERKSITVFDGSTIRGRLLRDGKPLAHVEIGLRSHDHNARTSIGEVRIGTDEEGRFAFTNVPAGRVFDLYPTMDSIAPSGLTAEMVETATHDNGEEVNVGDIGTRPGLTLRGKVTLSTGEPIPPDMHISAGDTRDSDSQVIALPSDGTFEFKGLNRHVYFVTPSVKGYTLDAQEFSVEVLIEKDGQNLNILLKPQSRKR